jgi:predicted transglutaminase-like cysteine proteinase
MSANVRARGAAGWLPILLSLGFITASAAVDADATPDDAVSFAATAIADKPAVAPKPFVIALAMPAASTPAAVPPPTSALPPAANIAPLMSTLPAPAPARFFTINEVMAKRGGSLQQDNTVRLASADQGDVASDIGPVPPGGGKGDGPFGLFTSAAPDGQLWTKWRKVADEVRAEEPALMRCIVNTQRCSPAAERLSAIINDAREQSGRARFDLVNQRVNAAIHYKSDTMQWGVADVWSPPLAANDTGSFNTGFGDCEDFAIAKYVALRAAGIPASQLRVLLVHDNLARMDHAVLAARDDGRWYILDNRWATAVEDTEVRQFTPLFALDDQGVKLVAVPYAAQIQPMSEVVKGGTQKFVPGGDSADQTPQSSRNEVIAFGLRGSTL